MTATEFGVKAPRFLLCPPKLDIYLTLPGGKQIGPTPLQGGIQVKGLPPGHYQLTGQFEGFDPFSIHITLAPGRPVAFQPFKGASLSQRRAFRRRQGQDGKPTILYLQHRKRQAAEFWLGHAENEACLAALLTTEGEHSFEGDDGRMQSAMNEFAARQMQQSYDPDTLEAGFETGDDDTSSRFAAYSWAAEWGPELAFRASGQHPRYYPVERGEQNCLVMVGGDPDHRQGWMMGESFDVVAPGIELRFMGYIEFTYFDGGPAGR